MKKNRQEAIIELIQKYPIAYAARGALYDAKHIEETKKMIMKGFKNQQENKGFSIIEVLSPCPTNWKMSAVDAMEKLKEENSKVFPVKVYVDNTKGGK